ncbi:uncharacterized lipoprotein YddW (UPF0748 family) [Dysgonomonadaceae bacterium PH5-43]|nr:uncharacterized lipoprotein YddW (UPF0748 family) [Dysgonomonadaceae bacterium PH5-43]
MKRIILTLIIASTLLSIKAQVPKQEIRAVWLTSYANLDWPSKPYKNSNEINNHQDELIDILDKLVEANFNMVFLQTRIRGHVIYNSSIEPVSPFIQSVKNTWSKYDPLKFAIEECHKRGLECHAWIVTYNMGANPKDKTNSIKHKDLYYLDPGNPKTDTHLLSIVDEIVSKYDIDGIHFDYIRYPENASTFADDNTYKLYGKGKTKAKWRCDNITNFVSKVYDKVKKQKPWVQVSTATVGMYSHLPSVTRKHWTALESVHQDPDKWLKDGIVDFVVPMMYYKDDLFLPFLKDWQKRSYGRLVIPGLAVYNLDEKEENWTVNKINEQIKLSREHNAEGNAFFRTRHLMTNKKNVMNEIRSNFYQFPATLPPLTWLDDRQPVYPLNLKAKKAGVFMVLSWDETVQPKGNEEVFYNIYRSRSLPVDITKAENLVKTHVSGSMAFLPIDIFTEIGCYYVVTTYNRYHNESVASPAVYFKTSQ